MEDSASKMSADDLGFDVDVEIPNANDVHLVAQYAEMEKKRLAEEAMPIPAADVPPRVVMESVPGDNASSDEEGDAVKKWCATAGGLVRSERKNDHEASEDDFLEEDCKKDVAKENTQTQKRNAKKEVEPPTINLKVPERREPHEAIDIVGCVHAFIEGTVVVRGLERSRALDLQSVLCFEDRVTLGIVCDTFGSVTEPHYLVYVTSPEVVASTHGELAALVGKQVYAVASESSFALHEEELSKALAGLSFMQPIEDMDDTGDEFSDNDSVPEASAAWLQEIGCVP